MIVEHQHEKAPLQKFKFKSLSYHNSIMYGSQHGSESCDLRPGSHLEKRKAEKRKPIRTRGKTEADKRNVPSTITASSDWFPLFQGVKLSRCELSLRIHQRYQRSMSLLYDYTVIKLYVVPFSAYLISI